MPTANEEVVHRYIAGCLKHDKESQYALFKHLHSYAMGICRRYAHNSDEASDILSESFLKIFNSIGQYDTTRPFKAWAGRIIANTAIDYYRASLRFASYEALDGNENIGNAAEIYGKLAYDDLLGLIRKLTPAYRVVFNLYAIDGYHHHEIAEILGISIGTSKANLHKARKKLQEMLDEYEEVPRWMKNKTAAGK